MNNNSYNKLPDNIKRKFKIVYSEWLCDNITMFKNRDGKWGVLTTVVKFGFLSSYDYLVKPVYGSVGFNKGLKLIEAVAYENNVWDQDKNTFLYFDLNGALVWRSKKGERVRIDSFGNIFLSSADKTGLLDTSFVPLIEPGYQQLNALNNTFFTAFRNGKYGIIDRNDVNILDFECKEIYNVVEKNKVIVRKNEQYFSFDLENRVWKALPFSKILKPSSNTYKAPSPESFRYYKSITGAKENTGFDEYDYEMVRYTGKWGIVDGAGEIVIPNDYCFVDFLRNPGYFKVGMGDMEVVDYEDGEDGYRTSVKNVKWGIVDINNEIIVPVEYDWIDEVEATVWVVYKGGAVFYNDDYQEDYWTIKNGKLGVYNLEKLIIPIEYDSIKTSWFRIKDYIFVQKGTSYFDESIPGYDVFTLDGKKIESNKPVPADHNNNG